MSDLNDLAAWSEAFVGRIAPAANDISKRIALAIIQDFAVVTPVDRGVALSNWQVSLGNPADGVLPAYSPSPRGKVDPSITRNANSGPMIEAAVAIIESKVPGLSLYITNNVSYIQFLNDGSSQQSPGGFVERANIIAQQMLDNIQI